MTLTNLQDIRRRGLEKISRLLDLELNYSHARHSFETGLPLESSLRHFFRPYFPTRYGFSSGYIVDASGEVSNQTDWIVYDSSYFTPMLAQVHGIEGAEWFPFESIYGCVEVKRTLSADALKTACEQIARTRKLSREPTGLLQLTPQCVIPPSVLNFPPGTTFDEICNPLYTGIYAFQPGAYEDPDILLSTLEEISKAVGFHGLPDFIAVHGRYYIRRANVDDKGDIVIAPFPDRSNAFVVINSKELTAGVFCMDLVAQFASTSLSARTVSRGLISYLRSQDMIKVTGRRVYA